MGKLSELLWEEDSFEVKLRCENHFDDKAYGLIVETLRECTKQLKAAGSVPTEETVALMGLVDTLARGSEYYDDETEIKVENACIEVQDIINSLL